MKPTPLALLAAICAALLAGCTPTPAGSPSPSTDPSVTTSSPSPTPSQPSPSSTQSLSTDQQAALDGLTRADDVSTKLGRDPASFTKASATKLAKTAYMDPLLPYVVRGVMNEKAAGLREQGEIKVIWVKVGRVEDLGAGGKRVVITRCADQRDLVVVSAKSGKPEAKRSFPEWHTQETALRKAKGADRWLAAGVESTSEKKCQGA